MTGFSVGSIRKQSSQRKLLFGNERIRSRINNQEAKLQLNLKIGDKFQLMKKLKCFPKQKFSSLKALESLMCLITTTREDCSAHTIMFFYLVRVHMLIFRMVIRVILRIGFLQSLSRGFSKCFIIILLGWRIRAL